MWKIIVSYNQSMNFNQNNIFSSILHTVKYLKRSIFGIFHGLLSHCSHSTTWQPEYDIVQSLLWLAKHIIFDHPNF